MLFYLRLYQHKNIQWSFRLSFLVIWMYRTYTYFHIILLYVMYTSMLCTYVYVCIQKTSQYINNSTLVLKNWALFLPCSITPVPMCSHQHHYHHHHHPPTVSPCIAQSDYLRIIWKYILIRLGLHGEHHKWCCWANVGVKVKVKVEVKASPYILPLRQLNAKNVY